MRLALSVIGLLLAAYVVLTLTRKQAEVLVARPPARAASASDTAASTAATPMPRQVQQDVQKALEQGMQQRASTPGL
ncbi:MAG: hypothetical protein HY855_11190 [Burkholderiales bacterium]|nr:hypothetical protein [Burkholderiales bacterium]